MNDLEYLREISKQNKRNKMNEKFKPVQPDKNCTTCKGRGIIDLPGEGDVGWGHVEPCPKCGKGKKS